MTRPCLPHPPPPSGGRAEPTRPGTQRGGGCFCNLATLSIFSIHSVPRRDTLRPSRDADINKVSAHAPGRGGGGSCEARSLREHGAARAGAASPRSCSCG
ncbi:hypothetical protein KM043_016809 [Ampulex compressa]|nr:hypothetical protein KM043_016809 [Ampulex compressa]